MTDTKLTTTTGAARCKAVTKAGKPCSKAAVRLPDGTYADYCKEHGGERDYLMPSPVERGTGLPPARRYIRKLPANMAQEYDELLGDTQLMRLEDDIVLIDLRVGQLLRRLPSSDTEYGLALEQVRESYDRILRSVNKNDKFEADQGLKDLEHAIEGPEAEKEAWAEIQLLLDQRYRLIRLHVQREKVLQKFIPIDRLMSLVQFLVDVITQHANAEIGDKDDARRFLEAVKNDIKRIL